MADIKAPRPFEEDEQSSLSTLLKSQLNLHNVSCAFQADADAEDLVKYICEMVDDGENVGHVIDEIRDLGFDEICAEYNLENIRERLTEFLGSMEGRGWKNNKWSAALNNDEKEGSGGARDEEIITAVPSTHKYTQQVTDDEDKTTTPPAPTKEDPIARSTPNQSPPQSAQTYAEEIQTRVRAKHSTVVGFVRRPMTYAEEIQAREKSRGEELVKNSASMQANIKSRSGGASTTIETKGLGYSGFAGKKKMSYAEEIQARERERGEELIKNSASMQANRKSRSGGSSCTTIETKGLGYSGASGKKQMSYAEEIQAREKERGEEVVRNNASKQAFARRASLLINSSRDETSHDSDYDSPDHVDADLSDTYVNTESKKELDAMRREELMAVMKDRSLEKGEKEQKMKEIREKYSGLK